MIFIRMHDFIAGYPCVDMSIHIVAARFHGGGGRSG